MKWLLVVVVLLVAVGAGCGDGRRFVEPLSATTRGPMRFVTTPAPLSAAPGLGPAHLVFLSPRLGFVATTGGGFYQEATGYVAPTEAGLIEQTRDGGASWQIVWRSPHVVFERIAFADRGHGVAVGNVVLQQHAVGRRPPLRPLVL